MSFLFPEYTKKKCSFIIKVEKFGTNNMPLASVLDRKSTELQIDIIQTIDNQRICPRVFAHVKERRKPISQNQLGLRQEKKN